MIPETGTKQDFKRWVLDFVVPWAYTCGHRRVLLAEDICWWNYIGECPECQAARHRWMIGAGRTV